jgi:hypothetical protein
LQFECKELVIGRGLRLTIPLALLTGWMMGSLSPAQEAPATPSPESPKSISVRLDEDCVTVTSDGELFASYVFSKYARPILYPLKGPGNLDMTRHFPMQEGVAGESTDHPHHQSLWFAHGDVNGFDFWSAKSKICTESVKLLTGEDGGRNGFVATNHWLGDSAGLLTENATFRFSDNGDQRLVDFDFVLTANTDVTFGDTKEGTFAVRTHPNLQLIREADDQPVGHAENSQGQVDGTIWGQPAKWVCYFGTIEDTAMGLALFDHPQNLRHPTTWHARDYGLVAANPFGLHDFLQQPKGSGNFTLREGEQLRLRYCVVLFQGSFDRTQVNEWYEAFANREK